MKKSSGPSLEGQVLIAPRNDNGKKIYRAISEAARRLDSSRLNATSISELFASNIEIQRIKLRDSCEKLLFSEPLLFGRKSQELLWRKSYYDVIYTAKKLLTKSEHTDERSTDTLILYNHIDSGIGYYNFFLFKLQNEFCIDLNGIIDLPITSITDNVHLSNEVKKWAYLCAHSCLISLGDLSRYKLELDPSWGSKNAEHYYKQAIYLDSRIGMPYNQLGTLSGSVNYHLDAVYFYIHCLLSPQPFDGAENNLKIIFEKNRMYVESIKSEQAEDDYMEHIKICISRFLYLFEVWIFNKTDNDINDVCHAVISDFKECILYMEPLREIYDEIPDAQIYLQKLNLKKIHPEYLDPEMIFKISVICVMCVQKLQDNNSSHVSLVKAFTLAIFLELIDFVIENINDYIYEIVEAEKNEERLKETELPDEKILPDAEAVLLDEILPNGVEALVDVDTVLQDEGKLPVKVEVLPDDLISPPSDVVVLPDTEKVEIKKLIPEIDQAKKNCRRRRRRHYSDSTSIDSYSSEYEDIDDWTDASESDEEEINNDNSEDEDSGPDMIIYEDSSSDIDDLNCKHKKVDEKILDGTDELLNGSEKMILDDTDNLIISDTQTDEYNNTVSDIEKPHRNEFLENTKDRLNRHRRKLKLDEILDFVQNEHVLRSIKILCDWLRSDIELIKSCATNSPNFLQRLLLLLNLINVDVFSKHYRERYGNTVELKGIKFDVEFLRQVNEVIPLIEDLELRGLNILENSHEVIDFDYRKSKEKDLTKQEESLLRVLKLVNFGFFISKLKSTKVEFNSKTRSFILRKYEKVRQTQRKRNTRVRKFGRSRSRRYQSGGLEEQEYDAMESEGDGNLGRLWLNSQLSRTSNRARVFSRNQHRRIRPDRTLTKRDLPSFVVIDSKALTQSGHVIRQIVMAKRTVVIVPLAVMVLLDDLKMESNRARDGVRWLEAQLANGNRFIRGQRRHESTTNPIIQIPKKLDRDCQFYIQIIECCNFFVDCKPSYDSHKNDKLPVVFLTGPDLNDFGTKEFSLLGFGESAGVKVERISSFYSRWKRVLKRRRRYGR